MFSYLVGGQYHGKLESKQQLFSHLLNSSIYMLFQLQKKPCGFVNYSMIFKQSKPLSLHCDNQSFIALTLNPWFHDRTKHIEIQYHFLWKKLENKELELLYCSIKNMWDDVFIKALPKPKHDICCHAIGLTHSIG